MILNILKRSFQTFPNNFKFAPNIAKALKDKSKPIVALESTIITHGMPYPQNIETALSVENIILQEGCLPATIAVLEGVVHVGLEKDQLEHLGKIGTKATKVSRRDLPYVISKKLNGSTTVSATSFIANKVGINIFATGGLGGVHRGFGETMDVSADLTELGKTPINVICAGVKSILDIKNTLEYLETQGVTVATLGLNQEFPAFYIPNSGIEVNQ